MENFIDQFYDLYLKNESFPFGKINKEAYQHEWGLYNMLYENLPEKYKNIFKEYIRAREDREREEKKAIYKNAFKHGMQLIMESIQK